MLMVYSCLFRNHFYLFYHSRIGQVHAIHGEMVVFCIFQYADARLPCCFRIHVIGGTIFGMFELKGCAMNEIGDYKDAVFLEYAFCSAVYLQSFRRFSAY